MRGSGKDDDPGPCEEGVAMISSNPATRNVQSLPFRGFFAMRTGGSPVRIHGRAWQYVRSPCS